MKEPEPLKEGPRRFVEGRDSTDAGVLRIRYGLKRALYHLERASEVFDILPTIITGEKIQFAIHLTIIACTRRIRR
jgi:hypothetical protein